MKSYRSESKPRHSNAIEELLNKIRKNYEDEKFGRKYERKNDVEDCERECEDDDDCCDGWMCSSG